MNFSSVNDALQRAWTNEGDFAILMFGVLLLFLVCAYAYGLCAKRRIAKAPERASATEPVNRLASRNNLPGDPSLN